MADLSVGHSESRGFVYCRLVGKLRFHHYVYIFFSVGPLCLYLVSGFPTSFKIKIKSYSRAAIHWFFFFKNGIAGRLHFFDT